MPMNKYIILPDVTCDLCPEAVDYFGLVDFIKGHIHFQDGRDFRTDLSWDNISPKEFYKLAGNTKDRVVVAPASTTEYELVFDKYLSEGYDVLSMSISSKISATYNFATVAANNMKAKYPDREIYCFDAYRHSVGFGILVAYALEMQKNGASMTEVIAWLEENKFCVHQMGPIDDLFFVARRGRISMGKAIMGTFAGVKPMGDFNAEGYTTVITKVKGIRKALDVTVEYVKKTIRDPENNYIFISHTDREEYALALKERIEKEIPAKKIFFSEVYAACGTNIGPGMISVDYLGGRITEDLAAETAIMNEILAK